MTKATSQIRRYREEQVKSKGDEHLLQIYNNLSSFGTVKEETGIVNDSEWKAQKLNHILITIWYWYRQISNHQERSIMS